MAVAYRFSVWSGWKPISGFRCQGPRHGNLVEEKAESLRPALEELIRQAAQGEVAHNDDTGMRILKLAREPGPEDKAERTGVFTSGIVSRVGARLIALFFSGWRHAGENLAEVLKKRSPALPPLI